MTLLLYKPPGLTPLQAIDKLRSKYTQYKKIKIGYAGRLDPMAEGILLLLVEDENKDKKRYERLTKFYRFKVLWGVETDTYDLLGMITNITGQHPSEPRVKEAIEKLATKSVQKYPPYSSVRVKGKPLFWWARNKMLGKIAIPDKKIEIYKAKYLNSTPVSSNDLLLYIKDSVSNISGDFRQEKIITMWENNLNRHGSFMISEAEIHCSSGTYVRSLCKSMGDALGTGATAYSIARIAIGEYTLESDILKLDED